MPPSTSVRMRAAGVTTRLNELTAEVTQERAVLEAAVSSGNPDRIMEAQAKVATLEAARTNLSPIAEALHRELAAAEAEEAREATLRRMVSTALEASAGVVRIGKLVPEIQTKFMVLVDQLMAEMRQQRALRLAFFTAAQALGAPLDDRLESQSARTALLEELRRRGSDLAAVLMHWCPPRTALDQPPALPTVSPLGHLIYDAVRELEFNEAHRIQREVLDEEAAVGDVTIY